MDKNVRILVADDHPILRDGLRRLLESEPGMKVIAEASDGNEAVEFVRKHKPDVLLLDLAMPRRPGMDALRELSDSRDPVRTILLTAAIDKPQLVEALQLGARGVVLKDSATQVLLHAIRAVMGGQFWVGAEAVSDLVGYLREQLLPLRTQQPPRRFGLTRRELEIVSTIVAGYTNRDIAGRFNISEDTVKHHLTNIFDKLGVSNRLELALFAINHQLADPV